ncbi:MAG: putative hydro-lyase [Burkholderiaceae bacterium]
MPEVAPADAGYDSLRKLPVPELRALIRANGYQGHTAGLAAGRLQTNLAIMPERHALDFMRFCQRNPKPCPLVGVTDTGDPMMRTLGDIDIRTDVPAYNVYRDGELVDTVADLTGLWRDDWVAFALGCSFTFEHALMAAGIPLRHIERNQTVAMYRTTRPTVKAGPFEGGMVVSMRPIREDDVERAWQISARYPLAHGAPVHVGDPAGIGIASLARPDWGDPPELLAGEVPMFWACGVTPQNAIRHARLPLVVTHQPGRMLITDVAEDAEVPVI